MNTQHSSIAETGSCTDSGVSEQVKQAIAKERWFSLSLEQIERIERLDQKYRDWVRKGIIIPQKYKAPPTPEEAARSLKIGGF